MSVLIVEDEIDARETLRDAFTDQGWDVSVAATGTEALAILAASTPKVVVLDLVMPGLSGNDVYDAMQREARLAGLPVVVTTSDPSRAPTGVLVMRKPLDLARLLATIRAIVEAM